MISKDNLKEVNRKTITEGVKNLSSTMLIGPIKQVMENLNKIFDEAQAKGYTELRITELGGKSFSLKLMGTREETDEELTQRIKKEQMYLVRMESSKEWEKRDEEMKLLAKLANKYEYNLIKKTKRKFGKQRIF